MRLLRIENEVGKYLFEFRARFDFREISKNELQNFVFGHLPKRYP